MQSYFAFGGCLRSALEFPDLSPSSSNEKPDWEIQASDSRATEPGEIQGEREVEPGWSLRLYRLRDGWRLEYGATGSYEVLDRGRRLVWHRGTDRREEVVRAVVLGPLMALALHESGILCLHGSAVSVAGKGIGFLAPKGYGKSTLALALAAAGGRLMSDDLVAVARSATPEILPGVHSARVRSDVAELMGEEFPDALLREGWKKTFSSLPKDRLAWERTPLDALYLVRPVSRGSSVSSVSRTQVGTMEAAMALTRNTKLTDDLIGYREAGRSLRWIGEIVSKVSVYELEVLRDLDSLADTAVKILSWHVPSPV